MGDRLLRSGSVGMVSCSSCRVKWLSMTCNTGVDHEQGGVLVDLFCILHFAFCNFHLSLIIVSLTKND